MAKAVIAGLIVVLTASTAIAAPAAKMPPNIGEVENQEIAYASGQYDKDLDSAGKRAMAYLNAHAKNAAKPALVLDIDETSLRNLEQLEASQFGYFPTAGCGGAPKHRPAKLPSPCGAEAWDAFESTPAIKPTLVLFKRAQALHVTVIFITGRHEHERAATEANLKAAGYEGYAKLYMEPDNYTGTAAAYKTKTRQQVQTADGYHIVLKVGDQPSDLSGGFSDHTVLYPDPFYRTN